MSSLLVLSGYLSLLIFTLGFKLNFDIFKNQRTVWFWGFFLLGLKIRIQQPANSQLLFKNSKEP
jgi:hypothetical protein